MSSSRLSYRKRRSDDECSSSESDEDSPPIKRSRLRNKESNIKDIITGKFLNLVNWIYQLPVGNREKENMLKNTIDLHVPIKVPDEEEDIDVVEIDDDDDDDDDPIIKMELSHNSDRLSRREGLRKSAFPLSIVSDPVSSTPFLDCRTTRGRTLGSLARRPVNGCNGGKTYPTRDKRLSSQHQTMRFTRSSAPITNPCSDVEILLDTRDMPNEESDDLKIVSEISDTKPSRRITRQTASKLAFKFDPAPKKCNGTSLDNTVNGKTASSDAQRSLTKSFTAHEVIRLQEKAHYQLILDKMIGTSTYHPLVPKTETKSPEIQIDLTGDQPIIPSHFKKEVLEKPVNEFLQKYYKPCQYNPCAPPKDNPDNIEIFTVDDDIQVIDKEPIEYYRPKSRNKPEIFSTEWINELKKVINQETEQRLQIVAAQEEKIERYRKRRDAKIEKEKLLRGLQISEKAEKDDFPELTPDMDERIDWALGPGPLGETLSTFNDQLCNRSDISTLAGLNWLNDSVINFYLTLIKERSQNHPVYPSVYVFSSFFYTSLKRGPEKVMRWTRKVDIFEFDILFVPLHLGMHWALCTIDNRTKKIKYYDSMLGKDDQCLRILQKYLVVEKENKKKIIMDPNEYSLECVKDIPQQMNGSDCGMFTLKYAEYLSRDAPITFSQEHMQYFRRRMVLEILDKKLF